MSDMAIRIENLSKAYRIGEDRGGYKTLRDTITNTFSATLRRLGRGPQTSNFDRQSNSIWALKDISFEVKRGEVVGIIGRNGAGKTTLLKILSRITEPTEGWAEIHGRVGSLLEVGTGFHPELTGRENIYLSGAILGMRKTEIDREFDEIVAFAEIEKFIDTPVKRYSSGMYVRLAFAVAAHLEPEILLVDEVLAVGDAAFQKKCLGKMGDVASEGRTVLFVSHNMGAVQDLCSRCMLLEQGEIRTIGKPASVISSYLNSSRRACLSTYEGQIDQYKDVSLLKAKLVGSDGKGASTLKLTEPIIIETLWAVRKETSGLAVAIFIKDGLSRVLLVASSEDVGIEIAEPGIWQLKTEIPNVLLPGEFRLDIMALVNRKTFFERVDDALGFGVVNVPWKDHIRPVGPKRPGFAYVLSRWERDYSELPRNKS
jgi:lipopolysaccharide transport system ATP-binding protein